MTSLKNTKIICVVGARPQFIKHGPVLRAFRDNFSILTVHTCQHYDQNMSQIFFDELNIPEPEFILEETARHRGHGAQTAFMLSGLESLFIKEKPDAVLVYGDTNSTLAGALAASKLQIPILHVEAGLRSFNRSMPEEINRVLTDHLSSLLFAPTQSAVDNLQQEGIAGGVHIVGDVMVDAVHQAAPRLEKKCAEDYLFATLHRPYNVDEPKRLRSILSSLNACSLPVVLPLHPRTKGTMDTQNIEISSFPNIEFISPVGYLDCLSYQKFSQCVITDSGGIQKEAYTLKRKCLTVRYETEWTETLRNGCNTLVGENPSTIPNLSNEPTELRFEHPYGSGHSAETMARLTHEFITANQP